MYIENVIYFDLENKKKLRSGFKTKILFFDSRYFNEKYDLIKSEQKMHATDTWNFLWWNNGKIC